MEWVCSCCRPIGSVNLFHCKPLPFSYIYHTTLYFFFKLLNLPTEKKLISFFLLLKKITRTAQYEKKMFMFDNCLGLLDDFTTILINRDLD